MNIKVSSKSLNLLFHPCTENFITNVCKGKCCQGSDRIMVTIHESEIIDEKFNGEKVINNFLIPDHRNLCPFKNISGLCNIHKNKPIGCIFSPFTLNKNNTLIIRYRYIQLPCYRIKENKAPSYIAFRKSLETIFKDNVDFVIDKIIKDKVDFYINIDEDIYNKLKENDLYKKGIR